MSLPGGARPACTDCLKDTMSIFAAAANHKQSSFRNNYAQAAQVVDLTCGPSFVEAGVASSGVAKLGDGSNLLIGLTAMMVVFINAFL